MGWWLVISLSDGRGLKNLMLLWHRWLTRGWPTKATFGRPTCLIGYGPVNYWIVLICSTWELFLRVIHGNCDSIVALTGKSLFLPSLMHAICNSLLFKAALHLIPKEYLPPPPSFFSRLPFHQRWLPFVRPLTTFLLRSSTLELFLFPPSRPDTPPPSFYSQPHHSMSCALNGTVGELLPPTLTAIRP